MARSWFELTLWHGTPEELTSRIDTKIDTDSRIPASIDTNVDLSIDVSSKHTCVHSIDTEMSLQQEMIELSCISTRISQNTEVIRYG